MSLLARLENLGRPVQLLIGLALIALMGLLDYGSGYEFAFSVFYVIPVLYFTWLLGSRHGYVASVLCALVWLWADLASGHPYLNPVAPYWNTFIRLAFFVLFTWLLAALRDARDRERELARVDFLTGAVNSRYFFDLLQREIERCRRYRHPLTLAYFDLDNFKAVNDRQGHLVGDRLLQGVATVARGQLRRTDVLARLGGDEFALLLPETGAEDAGAAIGKVQRGLLEEMQRNGWPVTFSVGAVSCLAPPPDADELIRLADDLMYSAKRAGKNRVAHVAYDGAGSEAGQGKTTQQAVGQR